MFFISKILTFVLLIAVPLAKAAVFNLAGGTTLASYQTQLRLIVIDSIGNTLRVDSDSAEDIIDAIYSISYIVDETKNNLAYNTATLTPVALKDEIVRLLALKTAADIHLANYVAELTVVETFLNAGTAPAPSWRTNTETCLKLDTNTSKAKLTDLPTLLPFVATFVTESTASVGGASKEAKGQAFDKAFVAAKKLLESEKTWKAFYKANEIEYPTTSPGFPSIQKHLNIEYLKFKAAYENIVKETNKIFVDASVKAGLTTATNFLKVFGKIFTPKEVSLLKVYKFGKYKAERAKLTGLVATMPNPGLFKDLEKLLTDVTDSTLRGKMSTKLKAIKLVVDGVFSANGWVADPKNAKFEEIIDDCPLLTKMGLYTDIMTHLTAIGTGAVVTGEFKFSPVAGTTTIGDAAAGIVTKLEAKPREPKLDALIASAKAVGTKYTDWIASSTDVDSYNYFRKSVRDFIKAANSYFSGGQANLTDVFDTISPRVDESKVEDLKFETDKMLESITTKYNPAIEAINRLTIASTPLYLAAPPAWATINPTTCANGKNMKTATAGGNKTPLDLLDEGIKTEAVKLTTAIACFSATGGKDQLLAAHFAAFTFVEKCSLLMNSVYNSEPIFLDTLNEYKLTAATHPITIFHGFLVTKLNEFIVELNPITNSATIPRSTRIWASSSELIAILELEIGTGITMPPALSDLVTPSTGSLTKAHISIKVASPTIEDIFKYKQVILEMSKKEVCCDPLKLLYPSLTCVATTKQTSDFETLLNVEIKAIVGATNELTTKVNALSSTSPPTIDLYTDILEIEKSIKAPSGLKTLRDCPSYSAQIAEFDKLFVATAGQITVLRTTLTESINDTGLLYKLNKSLEDLIVAIKPIITAVYDVKTIGAFLLGTSPDFTLVGVKGAKLPPTHSPVIVTAEVSYTSYHGIYEKLVVSANKISDEPINTQLKGELTAILEELISFNLDVKSFTGIDENTSDEFKKVAALKTQAESIKNSINGTSVLTIPTGSSFKKEVVTVIERLGADALSTWRALLNASSNNTVADKTFSKVTVTSNGSVEAIKNGKIAEIFTSSNGLLLAAKKLLEAEDNAVSEISAKINELRNFVNALTGPGIPVVTNEVSNVNDALHTFIRCQSAVNTTDGKEPFKVSAKAIATAVKDLALKVLGVTTIPNDINPQLTEEVVFTPKAAKPYSENEWIGIYQILSGKLSALVADLSDFDAKKAEIGNNIKEIGKYEIYPFTPDSNVIKPKLNGLMEKFKSDVAKHFSDSITPAQIIKLRTSLAEFIDKSLEAVIREILVNFTNKTFHTKINTESLKPVDPPKKDEKGVVVIAPVPDDAGENQNVTKFKDAMDKFRPEFNAIKVEIRALKIDSSPEKIGLLMEKTNSLISDLETSCENKEDEEFIKFKAKLDACSSSLKEFKEAKVEGKEAALTKLKDAVTSVESSIEEFERKHLEFMGKFKLSAMAITFIVFGAIGGVLVVVVVIYLVTKNRGAPETEAKKGQVVGSSKV